MFTRITRSSGAGLTREDNSYQNESEARADVSQKFTPHTPLEFIGEITGQMLLELLRSIISLTGIILTCSAVFVYIHDVVKLNSEIVWVLTMRLDSCFTRCQNSTKLKRAR